MNDMIKDIISSEYFMLALTFGVFYAEKYPPQATL